MQTYRQSFRGGMKMIANKCRHRLSTIQQSYPGHMDELLKELDELELLASKQIPIVPTIQVALKDTSVGNITFNSGTKLYSCKCNKNIAYRDAYCRYCGQKLSWGIL